MTTLESIKLFLDLYETSRTLVHVKSTDDRFKKWYHDTYLAFVELEGLHSFEAKHFKSFQFTDEPASPDNRRTHYDNDLMTANAMLSNAIDAIMDRNGLGIGDVENHAKVRLEAIQSLIDKETETRMSQKKVFISHSTADANIVDELLDMLKLIGLRQEQIFCSSVPSYGIPLGDDLFARLKEELNEDIAVIFVLSENFFNSPYCLAEMGASWVLSKDHAPLVVPPFDFGQVRGVLKNTIGITINAKHDINLLSEWIEKQFGITNTSGRDWERSRDKILGRINEHINVAAAAKEAKLQVVADESGKTLRQLKDIITMTMQHMAGM